MQAREAERDPVLPEIVAGRHLAAETVAPVLDGHDLGIVIERVDEYRHPQAGPADGVGHGAFVAEVWQRDEDAVNFDGVLFEQVGALLRVFQGFDRAKFGCTPMPSFSSVARISLRPVSQRWAGKKPRLPTIMPRVVISVIII